MKSIRFAPPALALALGLSVSCLAFAAEPASDADRAFVAQVSQGGAYEVEAGKVAASHGGTPAVKNLGVLESHDHMGVNKGLKKIADSSGIKIKSGLNAEFSGRLAKLKAVAPADFDAYYVNDMKQIHTKDEGLFSKEADEGSAGFKDFAHQTAVLVNAHLGWLNTL